MCTSIHMRRAPPPPQAVPLHMLSEEYRDGSYQVLRLCLLEACDRALG